MPDLGERAADNVCAPRAELQRSRKHVQREYTPRVANTRFVVVAVGDQLDLHLQANAALATLIAFGPSDAQRLVFTSRPESFRWLGSAVQVHEVPATKLEAWQGPQRYFFRSKFCALRDAARLGPAHVVLLDSDVLVRKSLDALLAALDRGECVMHAAEKPLRARAATRNAFRRHFGSTVAGHPVSSSSMVFNSGVVGIPSDRHALIEQALEVTDAFLSAGVNYFAIEQVAWSLVTSRQGPVHLAIDYVDHYWGNKRGFRRWIGQVLAQALVEGWSPAETGRQLAHWPASLPLRIWDRWWHEPLLRWLRIPRV